MKSVIKLVPLIFVLILFSSLSSSNEETCSLTIEVKNLRNSIGFVQFALYNKDGTIPDEDYNKFYKIAISKIVNGSSEVTFNNLPRGKYAVNILHDENKNNKIDKGLILPKEGIGFSNIQSIGFSNRPSFTKASFNLLTDTKIKVKVIYM